MLVRKGMGQKDIRAFCQTSFCISFASVCTTKSAAKGWRCIQAGLPEKKSWRARIRSILNSCRGKQKREWDLETWSELWHVNREAEPKSWPISVVHTQLFYWKEVEMCRCLRRVPNFTPRVWITPCSLLVLGRQPSLGPTPRLGRFVVSCMCGGDLEEHGGRSWEFKI